MANSSIVITDSKIIIGVDTKTVQINDIVTVLSYQFYGIAGDAKRWFGIYTTDNFDLIGSDLNSINSAAYCKCSPPAEVLFSDNHSKFYHERLCFGCLLKKILDCGLKEDVFDYYPKTVYLTFFSSTPHLATILDFHDYKNRALSSNLLKTGKFAGVKESNKYFVSCQSSYITPSLPIGVYFSIGNHIRRRKVNVFVYDCKLYFPEGSLSEIGNLVDLPRVDISEKYQDDICQFFKDDPQSFNQYALRDAQIVAEFFAYFIRLYFTVTGHKKIPATAGKFSELLTLKFWKDNCIDRYELLGWEVENVQQWDDNLNKYVYSKKTVLSKCRHMHDRFATECFYGGRNESSFYGVSPVSIWNDWDIIKAYPTALSFIKIPDYKNYYASLNLKDYKYDVLGFARVRFEFPDSVKFPCLPVKTKDSLIFPQSGETCCFAPEIDLAVIVGAKIHIIEGIIIPWKNDSIKPFELLIKETENKRNECRAGSLEHTQWKLIANSIYGKLAQGRLQKRINDNRNSKNTTSQITNIYFAGYVTAFIRAMIAEIMNNLGGYKIISATTDGFITNAPEDAIKKAIKGVLCTAFLDARLRLSDNCEILEKKHVVEQLLSWRTRGQATVKEKEGCKIILARAGIAIPGSTEQKNNRIVDLFCNRNDSTTFEYSAYNTKKFKAKNCDYIKEKYTRKANMDFDFKRMPDMTKSGTMQLRGKEVLFFDTKPVKDVCEFESLRRNWQNHSNRKRNLLKTVEHLKTFLEYHEINSQLPSTRKKLRVPTRAPIKMAIRQFVRAYLKGEWGLSGRIRNEALSQWLNAGGYHFTVSEIKNQSRKSIDIKENSVPVTADILKFVEYVKLKFPDFDEDRFFILRN